VELPRIGERRGNLTPIYENEHVPFPIKRVYYLYDVPGGATRGGHAHLELEQLIVSVMGAFDVVLYDERESRRVRLDRAYYGLYIPRMIWRELENFSSGGICLVLASEKYEAEDYIRDYDDFVSRKNNESNGR
jgi:dTDP-4-dehydrorhamnose 3,5-epimerase-like enzyme